MTVTAEPHSGVASLPFDRPDDAREIEGLIRAAKSGNRAAWNALVRRYAPLVNSVARGYRLSASDSEDVSQTVWLKLFQNLAVLREARALPGWLKTTTQREALHWLTKSRRTDLVDPTVLDVWLDARAPGTAVDNDLLRFEADRALHAGLAELLPRHRDLLVMLHAEPQHSYREISHALGIPPGSIGPTRARCLEKLRKTDAVRTFLRSLDDGELLATA